MNPHRSLRVLFQTAAFLAVWAFWAAPAPAHKVIVFAYVQDDTVYVESKFSGGRKVKQGEVTVLDANGAVLFTGKTDDKGNFSFQPKKAEDLTIRINAGMGHMGEWAVSASELADIAATGPPAQAAPSPTKEAQNAPAPPPGAQPAATPAPAAMDPAVMEAVVAKAVKREIKPVLDMLVEAQTKDASFKDIMGGIGYILGLFGVAAYMAARNRDKKAKTGKDQ